MTSGPTRPAARPGPPWMRYEPGEWHRYGRGPWARHHRGPRSDVPLAVVVGVIELAGTYLASRHQVARRPMDFVGYLLVAAGPAALAFRRRLPEVVLLVAFGTTLAYATLGYPRGPIFLSLIVALLGTLARGRRAVAWAVLAAGFASFLWLGPLLGTEPAPSVGEILVLAAWLLVLLAVGEWMRAWRERAQGYRRAHEEQSLRRASEERLQIARELHDVLAHNISLINVQAGVALHLMDEQPEQARTALTAIRDASKDTLRELRAVLGVLRGVEEDAPRAPTAGLAQLDELVSRSAAPGLRVRARVEGRPRPVPIGVDLAAYRIVQEALTNVARHANATSVTVTVEYGDRQLVIRVEDDGRGRSRSPDGGGSGTGIQGMRERAEALGGELRAGALPNGGFAVTASLPLEP